MAKHETRKMLPCIQGLRLIAALGVMLSHVGFGDSYVTNISFSAGVNLFFCISAFLMMYTTEENAPRNYVAKRLIRLVPLYWLLTIVTFLAARGIVGIIPEIPNGEELIKSLLFIPYVRNGLKTATVTRPIVGPAWTMRFDVWVVFVFALAMKLNHKKRGFISCIICAGVMLLGYILPHNPISAMLKHGFWLNYIMGILTYFIWKSVKDKIEWRIYTKAIMSMLLGVAFVILFSSGKSIYLSVIAACVVLLLVLLLMGEISMPECVMRFGKMSYSFYLTHYYVILIIGRIIDFDKFTVATCVGTVIVALVSLVVAEISYRIVEIKFGNVLKRIILK